MGDIEKLEFEEMDDATKNILGDNGNEIIKEINENNGKDEKEKVEEEVEGLGIPLVGENETQDKRKYGSKGKYKQLNWEAFAEEQKKIFEELSAIDPMNSVIKISNIPNRDEFDDLITILKDEYGGRAIEFICSENGTNKFWHIFRKTNLFDVAKVIRSINETFYSEYFREFIQLDLTGTIPERNKGGNGKEFYLHMSSRQKAEILRGLKYFRGKESSLGLACCIFTFNRAKEKFEHLRTDKYKVYYRDDGYAKIIQEEMQEATQTAIARLVEGLPILLCELEEKSVLASNSEILKYEERKEDLKYQMEAVGKAISVIRKNKVNIPAMYDMGYIVLKEKAEGTYIPPVYE